LNACEKTENERANDDEFLPRAGCAHMSAGRAPQPSVTARVLIADDHPVILEGVKRALSRDPGIEVIGQARDSTELVARLGDASAAHGCVVVVTDLAMPGGQFGDGLQLIGYLQRHFDDLLIVVLTMLENPALLTRLVDLGVNGIVCKSDELAHVGVAVHDVMNGVPYSSPSVRTALDTLKRGAPGQSAGVKLSVRELEVVRLFVSGLTITQISERLNRSVKTISAQKTSAMRKLGLERDPDLFKYAQSNGLLSLASSDSR